LTDYQNQATDIIQPRDLLRIGAQVTRNFAKRYPARYTVMMQYQLRPSDPEEAEIIYSSLRLFKKSLQLYELSDDALIDTMRMVNAAIYGFIVRENSELMTLSRSPDRSYEVMLDALLVAIKHIQQNQN
jgi:hypothetical protein